MKKRSAQGSLPKNVTWKIYRLRWYQEEGFSKKYRVRSRKITQARQRVSQPGVLLQMDGS